MTRKDYIILAKALNKTLPVDHDNAGGAVWQYTVVPIAEALKADNSNMDYDKFIEACVGEIA